MVALAQRTAATGALADYARNHGNVPADYFRLAGWREAIRKDRPAFSYRTVTGKRYRFTDGQDPRFDQDSDYQACWYGLDRALSIEAQDCPPILTNGAASVIAGHYHGVPAFALSTGESPKLPPDLLDELAQKYPAPAPIWIAPDQDKNQTGIKSARKRAGQLTEAGYIVRILDLGLTEDKADLADFCGRHGADSLGALRRCSDQPLIDPNAPARRERPTYDRVSSADQDRAKDEIRSRLSCYDYMESKFGAPRIKSPGYGQWLAPHRAEKTPSFTAYIDPARGWRDYGPGESGDIFSLIMLVEKCDFRAAIRIAADGANVQLPEKHAPTEYSRLQLSGVSNHESVPDALPTWTADIPAVLDDFYPAFKLALSPLILLKGVLKARAQGKLSSDGTAVEEIAHATGLTERQARNALEKDDGILFARESSRQAISPFFAHERDPYQGVKQEGESPKAKNGEISDSAKNAGRRRDLWALNDPNTVIEKLIERVAIPRLKMRHFPSNDPKRYAPPDKELLSQAGLDLSLLAILEQHMIYPDGNTEALRAFERDLMGWRNRLRNWEPLTLPDLPEPITNGKLYRAAKVAAVAMKAAQTEGKISLDAIARQAQVSRRAVTDLLPVAGWAMDENIHYEPVGANLPEPDYSFTFEGFPAYYRTVDQHGEFHVYPYTGYDKETKRQRVTLGAARHIQAEKAAGRPVDIGYRQAGTPHKMAPEERERVLAGLAVKRTASKPSVGSKAASKPSIAEPAFDMPGYSSAYATAWLKRLPDHLPADVAQVVEVHLLVSGLGGTIVSIEPTEGEMFAALSHPEVEEREFSPVAEISTKVESGIVALAQQFATVENDLPARRAFLDTLTDEQRAELRSHLYSKEAA